MNDIGFNFVNVCLIIFMNKLKSLAERFILRKKVIIITIMTTIAKPNIIIITINMIKTRFSLNSKLTQ